MKTTKSDPSHNYLYLPQETPNQSIYDIKILARTVTVLAQMAHAVKGKIHGRVRGV